MNRPHPSTLLSAVSRHTRIHPSLILDTEARAYHNERALYARLLREVRNMSFREIARTIGYSSHAEARRAVTFSGEKWGVSEGIEFCKVASTREVNMHRDQKSINTTTLGPIRIKAGLDGSMVVTRAGDPAAEFHTNDPAEALRVAREWLGLDEQEEAA